jgi:hypothetical protein
MSMIINLEVHIMIKLTSKNNYIRKRKSTSIMIKKAHKLSLIVNSMIQKLLKPSINLLKITL